MRRAVPVRTSTEYTEMCGETKPARPRAQHKVHGIRSIKIPQSKTFFCQYSLCATPTIHVPPRRDERCALRGRHAVTLMTGKIIRRRTLIVPRTATSKTLMHFQFSTILQSCNFETRVRNGMKFGGLYVQVVHSRCLQKIKLRT